MHFRLSTFSRYFIVILGITVIGNLVVNRYATVTVEARARWVEHSHQVILTSQALLTHLTEAESGQRGYLVTGNPSFMAPYNDGYGLARRAWEDLLGLMHDNATQQSRLAEVQRRMSEKFSEMAQTISLADAGKREEALSIVRRGSGRLLMEEIRSQLALILAEEKQLLEYRQNAYQDARESARLWFTGANLGMVLLMLVFFKALKISALQPILDLASRIRCYDMAGRLDQKIPERLCVEVRLLMEAFVQLSMNLESKQQSLQRALEQAALSNRALEISNRELESFSYSVSHDLRAPLRSIDGFGNILLKRQADRLDEEGQDLLRRMRAAAQRMGQLIDDMLVLSRISRSELSLEFFSLSELAADVVSHLRESFPDRDVTVVIEPGLCVKADPRLVRIVLDNLLGNAWKFTGRTSDARVEFGCVSRFDTDEYFIRDNGAGFDMAYADKLFGAFQRLHSTSEFPGTGIGLATVARVIHKHGGQVRAEGKVGEGASFWFTLHD